MQSAYAAFVIAQSQKYRPNCMSSTRTCYVTNNVALPDFDTFQSRNTGIGGLLNFGIFGSKNKPTVT